MANGIKESIPVRLDREFNVRLKHRLLEDGDRTFQSIVEVFLREYVDGKRTPVPDELVTLWEMMKNPRDEVESTIGELFKSWLPILREHRRDNA